MRISKAFSDLSSLLKICDSRNQVLVVTSNTRSYSFLKCQRTSSRSSRHWLARNYHDVTSEKFTAASISKIKDVLQSNKIEFTEGFSSLIIKCPICTSIKRTELFINKVTGHTVCKGCKRTGDWNDLQSALSSKNSSKTDSDSNEKISEQEHPLKKYDNSAGDKWKALMKKSVSLHSMSADERRDVLQHFTNKVIADDVIKQLDLHITTKEDGSRIFLAPLKSSNDVVGFKEISPEGSEVVEPCRNCRGILLYKSKPSRKDATAVIVHSFKDFLALACRQLNYHIICLPYGVTSLPQDILPHLEKYKKIILWFGNERSCWDAARQFAKKLNEERCYFVRPTDETLPPRVLLEDSNVENYDPKKMIDKAEPMLHPSIISFTNIRQDILSSLHNIDKAQGVRWQRFPGLNSLLRGHRRGELTIITGPTGSGKTTFMSEYSLDLLMQGVSTLWGSFEIKNERLACTMLQQYAQLPLEENTDKYNMLADSFERLPLYFMTFHGQQPLKVVLEAVEHSAYVYDIAHVIIDNVQFMLGMLDSDNSQLDRFYRQDALIAAFRNFATRYNCHVTLVIHPRKERDAEPLTVASIFGGAKASQEADNVLIIQQKMLQSLKLKKYLQVAKNRYSGDLGIISLDFDKKTLSFSSKLQDGRSFNKEIKTVDDGNEFDKTSRLEFGDLHSCQ